MSIIERSLHRLEKDIEYRLALVNFLASGQGDGYDHTHLATIIESIDFQLDQLATVLAQYDNAQTQSMAITKRSSPSR